MPVTAVVQDTPRIERGYFTKAAMQALKPVNFHLKLKLSHRKNDAQARTAPEPPHTQPKPGKAAPARTEKTKARKHKQEKAGSGPKQRPEKSVGRAP